MRDLERYDDSSSIKCTQSASSLNEWNEIVSQEFKFLEVEARSARPFSATLFEIDAGKTKIFQCETTPSGVYHEPSRHGAEDFFLKVQVKGNSQIHSPDAAISMGPGDYIICENSRPYCIEFDETTLIASIPLSVKDLEEKSILPHALSFIKPSTTNPVRSVVFDYLQSLGRSNMDTLSMAMRDQLAGVLLELAVLSIDQERQDDGDVNLTSGGMSMFKHAAELIERRYGDENLCGKLIAREMGVSLRSLQTTFAAQGFTITAYIQRCRLTRARQFLTSAATKGIQVAEVAFAVGFKSHSQFSRAYKTEFGESPNQTRLLLH